MDILSCAHCNGSGICKHSKFELSADNVEIVKNQLRSYHVGYYPGCKAKVRGSFTLFCIACGDGNSHSRTVEVDLEGNFWRNYGEARDWLLDWTRRELEPGWWEEYLTPPICSFCFGNGYVTPDSGFSEPPFDDTESPPFDSGDDFDQWEVNIPNPPSLPNKTPGLPLRPDVIYLPPPKRLNREE